MKRVKLKNENLSCLSHQRKNLLQKVEKNNPVNYFYILIWNIQMVDW
jgi:hypothetical protein